MSDVAEAEPTPDAASRSDERGRAGPRPALLEMRWEDVLFAHWPVEPAVVDRRLPEGLSVDTYDGRAYLGVVPFVMADVRPRYAPAGRSFGELNLRTYVANAAGDPGVYFFSLDADDRLGVAVARRLFGLAYHDAEIDVRRTGSGADREVRFRARRRGEGADPVARFDASYGPAGGASRPEPGSLAAFLTERYRFFADGRRALYRGEIAHEPWPLAPADATIGRDDLFAPNGFERPAGDPILHYCRSIGVTAGRPRRA